MFKEAIRQLQDTKPDAFEFIIKILEGKGYLTDREKTGYCKIIFYTDKNVCK